MPVRDLPSRNRDAAKARILAELLQSKKFVAWRPRQQKVYSSRDIETTERIFEVHFTCSGLAKEWNVSTDTIRTLFYDEPGVLKIDRPETRTKRGYRSLRIPGSVAERVHRRLSGKI